MSDASRASAHEDFSSDVPNNRDLPDQPSLRHLQLEAKRRLAAGEFTTLHDAQLAVAREHGMSSWAALKERIAAAESANSHTLTQARWVFARFQNADAPGWNPPDHGELSGHLTERFLTIVPPERMARLLGSVAAQLRQGLVVIDAGPLRLRANAAATYASRPLQSLSPRIGCRGFACSRPEYGSPTRGSRSRRSRAQARCPTASPA